MENSLRGFRTLIKRLGATRVARIVCEPTGPCHRAFEKALSGKVPLVKVDPLQARRFAQACGIHGKTDAVMRAPWHAWARHSCWRRMSRSRVNFMLSVTLS